MCREWPDAPQDRAGKFLAASKRGRLQSGHPASAATQPNLRRCVPYLAGGLRHRGGRQAAGVQACWQATLRLSARPPQRTSELGAMFTDQRTVGLATQNLGSEFRPYVEVFPTMTGRSSAPSAHDPRLRNMMDIYSQLAGILPSSAGEFQTSVVFERHPETYPLPAPRNRGSVSLIGPTLPRRTPDGGSADWGQSAVPRDIGERSDAVLRMGMPGDDAKWGSNTSLSASGSQAERGQPRSVTSLS